MPRAKPPKKLRPGRPPRPAEKSVRVTVTLPPEIGAWYENREFPGNRHRACRAVLIREYEREKDRVPE